MKNSAPSPATVKGRMTIFATKLMESSKIDGPFAPIAGKAVDTFLSKADEDELTRFLVEMRDKVIPWLLEGERVTAGGNGNSPKG